VRSFSGDLHEVLFDVLIFAEMEYNGKTYVTSSRWGFITSS